MNELENDLFNELFKNEEEAFYSPNFFLLILKKN